MISTYLLIGGVWIKARSCLQFMTIQELGDSGRIKREPKSVDVKKEGQNAQSSSELASPLPGPPPPLMSLLTFTSNLMSFLSQF